uniref:Uncharacterized protein n=1 Tax=candidate division CPR3 bacterium TaxID=2268181 RepID=A0A7C5UVT1_UNCC3
MKRSRKIATIVSFLLIISVSFIQFIGPISKDKNFRFFPFDFFFNEQRFDQKVRSQEKGVVLGARKIDFPSYTAYGSEFTAIPSHKLAKNVNDNLFLGGLTQGSVFRRLNPDGTVRIDGDGTTYVHIYNVNNPGETPSSGTVTVSIDFYQVWDCGLQFCTNLGVDHLYILQKTINAGQALIEPLWSLLEEACASTQGCNPPASGWGPEVPWAGVAKVQIISTGYGFKGIFAVSETVSTNGLYSVGHDAFLNNIDYYYGASLNKWSFLINVGANEEFGDKFSIKDTEIVVGAPVAEGLFGLAITLYDSNGSSSNTIYIDHSQYGRAFLLSEILGMFGIQGSWRGSVEIRCHVGGIPGGYSQRCFVTANIINKDGDVAWGQNAFPKLQGDGDRYATDVSYFYGAYNIFDVDNSEITIFNPGTSTISQIDIQTCASDNCSEPNGNDGWLPKYSISQDISPKSFITISASDIPSAPNKGWLNILRAKSSNPDHKFIIISRDHGETVNGVAFGREHRHLLPENSVYTDVASGNVNSPGYLYFPAQFAEADAASENEIHFIPDSSHFYGSSLHGYKVSGTVGGNINHKSSVTTYYYQGAGSGVCHEKSITYPRDPDSCNPTRGAPAFNYLDAHYQGNILAGLTGCSPDEGGNPCMTSGSDEKFLGYSVMKLDSGESFAEYVNTLNLNFIISNPWEQTASGDTYSSDEVISPIPSDTLTSPWITPTFYSSFVFSSEQPNYDLGDSPQNLPSYRYWNILGYEVNEIEDIYNLVISKAVKVPIEIDSIEDIEDYTEPGIYKLIVSTDELNIDINSINDDISPSLILIESTQSNLTVNITPKMVKGGDENNKLFTEGNLDLVPTTSRVLVFVVKGNVKIKPGKNAPFFDGGDFLDAGIAATGSITIENDEPQLDPLGVKGFLYANGGVEIQRDIGPLKSTVFPSVKVFWNPAYIVAFEDVFEQMTPLFSIPGLD